MQNSKANLYMTRKRKRDIGHELYGIDACAICLEEFTEDDIFNERVVMCNSGHGCHRHCMQELVSSTMSIKCPTCRTEDFPDDAELFDEVHMSTEAAAHLIDCVETAPLDWESNMVTNAQHATRFVQVLKLITRMMRLTKVEHRRKSCAQSITAALLMCIRLGKRNHLWILENTFVTLNGHVLVPSVSINDNLFKTDPLCESSMTCTLMYKLCEVIGKPIHLGYLLNMAEEPNRHYLESTAFGHRCKVSNVNKALAELCIDNDSQFALAIASSQRDASHFVEFLYKVVGYESCTIGMSKTKLVLNQRQRELSEMEEHQGYIVATESQVKSAMEAAFSIHINNLQEYQLCATQILMVVWKHMNDTSMTLCSVGEANARVNKYNEVVLSALEHSLTQQILQPTVSFVGPAMAIMAVKAIAFGFHRCNDVTLPSNWTQASIEAMHEDMASDKFTKHAAAIVKARTAKYFARQQEVEERLQGELLDAYDDINDENIRKFQLGLQGVMLFELMKNRIDEMATVGLVVES